MNEKNLSDSEKDAASIWVSFLITTKEKQRIRSVGNDFSYGFYGRYGWGGAGFGSKITVTEYKEGQLIIDFIDPKTNHIVWRGVGRKSLKSDLPIDSKTTAQEYVRELFNTVPGWEIQAD